MHLQIPSGQVRKVADHGYVALYRRRLNQNPLYWITYRGITIHFGKRASMVRKFNYYRGKSGQQVMDA